MDGRKLEKLVLAQIVLVQGELGHIELDLQVLLLDRLAVDQVHYFLVLREAVEV